MTYIKEPHKFRMDVVQTKQYPDSEDDFSMFSLNQVASHYNDLSLHYKTEYRTGCMGV
jgi:hypothetical protein